MAKYVILAATGQIGQLTTKYLLDIYWTKVTLTLFHMVIMLHNACHNTKAIVLNSSTVI